MLSIRFLDAEGARGSNPLPPTSERAGQGPNRAPFFLVGDRVSHSLRTQTKIDPRSRKAQTAEKKEAPAALKAPRGMADRDGKEPADMNQPTSDTRSIR